MNGNGKQMMETIWKPKPAAFSSFSTV